MNLSGYVRGHVYRTRAYIWLDVHYFMLFSSRVRVMVRNLGLGLGLDFSVWLVSCYVAYCTRICATLVRL